MTVKSILQFRLLRFVAYFIVASIVFAVTSEELGQNLWYVCSVSLFLAGIFSFTSEFSDAQGAVLIIDKSTADDFVEEMSILGFYELKSAGDHIYLRNGVNIVKLTDLGKNYQVELPAVYELVAERYRSV